jgi:hypothetical protein
MTAICSQLRTRGRTQRLLFWLVLPPIKLPKRRRAMEHLKGYAEESDLSAQIDANIRS